MAEIPCNAILQQRTIKTLLLHNFPGYCTNDTTRVWNSVQTQTLLLASNSQPQEREWEWPTEATCPWSCCQSSEVQTSTLCNVSFFQNQLIKKIWTVLNSSSNNINNNKYLLTLQTHHQFPAGCGEAPGQCGDALDVHLNTVEKIQGGVHCEPTVCCTGKNSVLFSDLQSMVQKFIAPTGLHLHDQQTANTSLYPLDSQPKVQGWETTLFTEFKTYVS